MSTESLAEHARRWAGHPTMPPVVSAYMPAADGDMSLLDELAERVIDAVQEGGWVPSSALLEYDDSTVYWTAFAYAGARLIWPDDRAAEQLAVWRSQIDGVA